MDSLCATAARLARFVSCKRLRVLHLYASRPRGGALARPAHEPLVPEELCGRVRWPDDGADFLGRHLLVGRGGVSLRLDADLRLRRLATRGGLRDAHALDVADGSHRLYDAERLCKPVVPPLGEALETYPSRGAFDCAGCICLAIGQRASSTRRARRGGLSRLCEAR